MEDKKITASLHTHVRSLYDADINPNALCDRIVELGGKGCAITDHAVLTSIEDYRPAFESHGLKMIPGVEANIDGGILGRLHLVLLAVNDEGYHAISKIVTKSNENIVDGFPVATLDMVKQYMSDNQGNVIALSGCMQGVVSAVFLQNDKVNKKIEKLQDKQDKYENPSSYKAISIKGRVERAQKILEELQEKRDRTKETAEQKFTKREKAVDALLKANDPAAELEKRKLEEDKKAADTAKRELPHVKEELNEAKKALSEAMKKLKATEESVYKYLEYEEQINALKTELKTDEELEFKAEAVMKEYSEIFGKGNFYAEIQYHGIPQEKECFVKVVAIARKLGLPIVATNDVHILTNSADDRLKRQILRSLRFGNSFTEESVGDSELYLKTDEELAKALSPIFDEATIREAISNIAVIFDRCNVEFKTGKHYPKYSKTGNADEILDEEIQKGIKWRFPEGMDEAHQKRLAHELPIIKDMGYADYHLVVKDFLEYGRLLGYLPKDKIADAPLTIPELQDYIKENGWKNPGLSIGPGRGSAVGSLVCYLLGITTLDPLKYGLLFERFLNPERVSMPDIDSDILSAGRGKVIDYVKNRYGVHAVCGISTQIMQAPKGSINIAAKYYGYKVCGEPMTNLGRTISREVPDEPGTTFASKVYIGGKEYPLCVALLKRFEGNKDAEEVIRWARIIEGSLTAYSAHAAGIVISDNDDVSDYLPLRMNTELGMMATQCDKEQVEENGLLKFDFLGLKTLDIITETLKLIEDNHGVVIDPLKIDLADTKIYKDIFAAGKTNSVFQFESSGMKSMLKRFKPQTFEDLIILVSMFRPGPLQYLDDVIAVKSGATPMKFLCPQLEPILGKTYGAIVYQEQVMQICQSLAGFTLGHADEVRRFMSKKKADKLAHEREAFIEGCKANGISASVANTLFDQMMDFASYAFNKSHAAAYAYNAYITAWLKYYYSAEFFTSALNWTTPEKLAGLMYEAKQMGVEVNAPDINLSGKYFETKAGTVRFGLASVAGVKDGANAILEERNRNGKFKSLIDFLIRCNPNSRVAMNLISAGAFDEFSKNRAAMKQLTEEVKDLLPKIEKKVSFVKSAEFVLPKVEVIKSPEELVELQTENGLKAEITDLTTVEKLEKRIANAKNALDGLKKELSLIRESKTSEDKTERMKLEKELLGIYVTSHPIDLYPQNSEVGAPALDDVGEDAEKIYGIITNLQIKSRKSDGQKMAFFTLEDRSGSISVSCFTKEYSAYQSLIREGDAVVIKGKGQIETFNEETELKFIAKEVIGVNIKQSSFLLPVSSYAAFFLEGEEAFMSEYKDDNGRDFLILDQTTGEIRRATYKVSERVKLLPKIEEVRI